MKIGIFGGSFNPPHIGHVSAAKLAMEQHDLELLIVVPTGRPPHKELPVGTPNPQMRLSMTQNAFGDCCGMRVSDIEIYSSERNYTIDTVRALKQEYSGDDLFILAGTDMYDSLDTWKDSDELLKIVTPILLPRDIIKISSSEVRDMLPNRLGREYLSDINYSQIIKNRLYGAKPDWDWLRGKAYSMLNPERIPHVSACQDAAIKLAEHWGADSDDAREAAILHDITKKLDFNENLCIIAEHGLNIAGINRYEEKLLHSITGAAIAKSEFGVSDKVANAITWHTTGKAGMAILEKIIYIADYIEATRDFPGVDDLRKIAYEDIDRAMAIGLEMTVSDLISRGIKPNKTTYEALNDLKRSN